MTSACSVVASCSPSLPSAPPAPEETCEGWQEGDLVITELMPDPGGVDTGRQYIELYNPTEGDVDLGGVSLFSSPLGAASEKRVTLGAVKIAPGSYFVLGDAAADPDLRPSHIDYGYGSGLGALRHTGGTIGLRCGEQLIDETSYSEVDAGRARELDGAVRLDASSNDDEANWCSSVTPLDPLELDGAEFGTPGAPNPECGTSAPVWCLDAASGELRLPVTPDPEDLVISEVMPAPAAVSDSDGEWIELYARREVDLNGLTLRSGSTTVVLSSAECLSLARGGYALLARSEASDMNGGLPPVTARLDFRLPNLSSALHVFAGDVLLDSFVWRSARQGVAWQLSSAAIDAPLEQRAAAFCPAVSTYGEGDHGTPRASNEPCPVVIEAGQCLDPQNASARSIARPQPGDLVITEFMAHPERVSDAVGEWFEVFARRSVDLNGLTLANAGSGKTTLLFPECVRAEAGTVLLFARSAAPEANGELPLVLATFSFALANSGVQAIELRSEDEVIDRVEYEGVTHGASTELFPWVADTIAGTHGAPIWCPTPSSQTYGRGDRGSPGAANVPCAGEGGAGGGGGAPTTGGGGQGGAGGASGQCRDSDGVVRDPVRPQPGDLIISEVMAAPTIGNNGPGEWFEIFVKSSVDLNELQLENQSGKAELLTSSDCLSAAAGEWLVFARSADPADNGGLPPVTATFGFTLADSGSDSFPERALLLKLGETELDRFGWTGSSKGVSRQLSSNALEAPACDEPASFCLTPDGVSFGGADRGTPAQENLPCP